MGGGWFFSDYRVSPNFLLCWGWVVVEVGLGCDNNILASNLLLNLLSILCYNNLSIVCESTHWAIGISASNHCGHVGF